jgi:chorismate mutase
MDIADWRKRIDELDRQLLQLLNQRAELVRRLAPLKRRQAIPIYEPEREREIFESLRAQNAGPLRDLAVKRIFQSIIEEMRAVQLDDAPGEPQKAAPADKGGEPSPSGAGRGHGRRDR